MIATGKEMLIKDGNIEFVTEIVYVMRNGKPTKKTKSQRIDDAKVGVYFE